VDAAVRVGDADVAHGLLGDGVGLREGWCAGGVGKRSTIWFAGRCETGLRLRHRTLLRKDHWRVFAADGLHLAFLQAEQVAAFEKDLAGDDFAGGEGSGGGLRAPVTDLPQPLSPTTATVCPGIEMVMRHILDGAVWPAFGVEGDW